MHACNCDFFDFLGFFCDFGSTRVRAVHPATSLGSALVSGIWNSHWVYWVGPYLGATLALLAYRALFP